MGGIPGQIVGELKGVVKDVGKQAVQAGKDIAKGTIEQIGVTPSSVAQKAAEGAKEEKGQAGADPQAAAKKNK